MKSGGGGGGGTGFVVGVRTHSDVIKIDQRRKVESEGVR